MDTPQHQKKSDVACKGGGESPKEGKSTKRQSPTTTSSPPSTSSSPSHEFSFTISLHPSSTLPDESESPPSLPTDLSPADDIFFHGHLLPLHFLSHIPISSRSSSNSLDGSSLPIRDILEDHKPNSHSNTSGAKGRSKPKPFSIFGLAKWRKGSEIGERKNEEEKKRKMRFDVNHIIKRYARMVRPFLLFRGEKRENRQLLRQPKSFSGYFSLKGKQEWRGGTGGDFSAPASMQTSPTNSGLLVATKTLPSSSSDSTMEELQSAIQAAIAHCKNSIAVEQEKFQC